jgi:hypothetical protein
MTGVVRIGNAHGFWGDRLDAAAEMLSLQPDLGYLTLDLLAEVSMSVLAMQQQRDPKAGYVHDIVDIVGSLTPYWRSGGRCRVITNAGGLDPKDCGRECGRVLAAAGCQHIKVAVVTGDDVFDLLKHDRIASGQNEKFRNFDTNEPIASVIDRLTTANAYLGAGPIVDALSHGADLVITGRVADPSLTVAACVHHFGWSTTDWDPLAGATVAGHLIECGTQVTGGIATDWMEVPDVDQIGFPIVEVAEDGSCVVTKPPGSGGCVTEATVKEQLLYEIGDPGNYLSPDVSVSFLTLNVAAESQDRVRVSGATGRPAPNTLKVSATYHDGYRASGQLTVFGTAAAAKARRAAQAVLDRLARSGITFRDSLVEVIGAGACDPRPNSHQDNALIETVMRISVADSSRDTVERFARSMMPLITAGPAGTTGYAEGRPRVHPLFKFWPCLIDREHVRPRVQRLSRPKEPLGRHVDEETTIQFRPATPDPADAQSMDQTFATVASRGDLSNIACARSGDKGRHANIGVIARDAQDFDQLVSGLSCDRVASYLGIEDVNRVRRFELRNLGAINFVIRDILDNPLKLDAQGKALGQVLLQMPWPPSVPASHHSAKAKR